MRGKPGCLELISKPTQYTVKMRPKFNHLKKTTNFGGFLAFSQPKWRSYAILAPIYNAKNYGQNLGQMSKKGQSTVGKAKGA